jgi:hypothetical protein
MKFEETQKFRQPWLWVLLIVIGFMTVGIFGMGICVQVVRGHTLGNHPMNNTGLIITFLLISAFMSAILLLFWFAKLTTVIDKRGIIYRFFPFHSKDHRIDWSMIEKFEVVKYDPIGDYGGWGIRYGRTGKAYNVSGDKGLKLSLKRGNHILIGTQRPRELADFLKNIG